MCLAIFRVELIPIGEALCSTKLSWPLNVLADLVRLWCMNTVEAIFKQEIQDIDASGGVNLGRVFACLHVFATSFKAAWEGGDEKMTEGRGAEWKVLPNQIWLPYDQWKLFHPPCIWPKDKKWRLKIQLHALTFSFHNWSIMSKLLSKRGLILMMQKGSSDDTINKSRLQF